MLMVPLSGNKTILSEQIAQIIVEDIKNGVLKPGEKLPSEKQLIEIFNVSRNTIREALRILKFMNIIDIRQGMGSFVTSVEANLLIDQLDLVFLVENTSIKHLFEARRLIEPKIAGIAAQRITDEEVDELYELLKQDNHDLAFHQKIADITRNPVLIRFVSSIWSLGAMSRQRTSAIPDVKRQAYEQNLEIVEALRDRDSQRAEDLMMQHLQFVEDNIRKKPRQVSTDS
jgi:DNA-binding FadR family transcriptional regulator